MTNKNKRRDELAALGDLDHVEKLAIKMIEDNPKGGMYHSPQFMLALIQCYKDAISDPAPSDYCSQEELEKTIDTESHAFAKKWASPLNKGQGDELFALGYGFQEGMKRGLSLRSAADREEIEKLKEHSEFRNQMAMNYAHQLGEKRADLEDAVKLLKETNVLLVEKINVIKQYKDNFAKVYDYAKTSECTCKIYDTCFRCKILSFIETVDEIIELGEHGKVKG